MLHFIYVGKLFLFFLKGSLEGLLSNVSDSETYSYVKTKFYTHKNVVSFSKIKLSIFPFSYFIMTSQLMGSISKRYLFIIYHIVTELCFSKNIIKSLTHFKESGFPISCTMLSSKYGV